MLKNIFLSFVLFKLKGKSKGVAMTEYAILLAFVAAIAAGVFVFDWSQSDWNEDGTLKGNSLGTAIYSGIFNAGAAIQRIIRDI